MSVARMDSRHGLFGMTVQVGLVASMERKDVLKMFYNVQRYPNMLSLLMIQDATDVYMILMSVIISWMIRVKCTRMNMMLEDVQRCP